MKNQVYRGSFTTGGPPCSTPCTVHGPHAPRDWLLHQKWSMHQVFMDRCCKNGQHKKSIEKGKKREKKKLLVVTVLQSAKHLFCFNLTLDKARYSYRHCFSMLISVDDWWSMYYYYDMIGKHWIDNIVLPNSSCKPQPNLDFEFFTLGVISSFHITHYFQNLPY